MITSLVSIIIPTYNRAHLIKETLESVLKQTYLNWECLIIDDGSTDNTYEVVKQYCIKDYRFQYHSRPKDRPKGANACRNYGFELSKGIYIKWLDSDDILSHELIFSQVITLSNSVGILNVSTSKFNFFKNSIKHINPKIKKINKNYDSGYELLVDFGVYNTFLPPHSYLIQRDIIFKSGLWNENLLINQDGEFFTRILLNSSRILHSKVGMVYYRYGFESNSTSIFTSDDKSEDAILSWILIDSYIKIYTKKSNSIKYVNNAKKYLKSNIDSKILKNKYSYFLNSGGFFNKIQKIIKQFQIWLI